MTDIAFTLTHSTAGSEWTLDGDDYAGLTWLSDTPKPTEKQIAKAYPLAVAARDAEQATKDAARVSAIAKLSALGLDALEVQAIIGTL